MAAITFNKVGSEYVAEFTANGTFALHIERAKAGYIKVEQSSVQGGGYAPVLTFPDLRNHNVVDVTLSGDVFPMYMKVTCETQPSTAVVTEA